MEHVPRSSNMSLQNVTSDPGICINREDLMPHIKKPKLKFWHFWHRWWPFWCVTFNLFQVRVTLVNQRNWNQFTQVKMLIHRTTLGVCALITSVPRSKNKNKKKQDQQGKNLSRYRGVKIYDIVWCVSSTAAALWLLPDEELPTVAVNQLKCGDMQKHLNPPIHLS